MEKNMNKMTFLAIALSAASFNVNAMGGMGEHEGPFLGINTMKDMCHMVSEDNSFIYKGPSETKLTMNKNFVLATCKGEYLQDDEMSVEPLHGRNQVVDCRIKVQGVPGFFEGTGGFTVDADEGTVSANCKANR